MAVIKILKNNTSETMQILKRDVAAGQSFDIPANLWLELIDNTEIQDCITAGDIIVNNGEEDLSSALGLEHVKNPNGIVYIHEDVNLIASIGENAPNLVLIDEIGAGYNMYIGSQIYAQTRVDGLIGNFVEFQCHLTIDNDVPDRWCAAELKFRTINAITNDKTLNTNDDTVSVGPVLLPSSPWSTFSIITQIPASYFQNGETYILLSIKRVTCNGKAAPVNNPIIWRICKRYWRS